MTDWVRARNYGIQTGDMQYVWPYMLDTYEKDIKFLKDIEGLYQRGGWVIAGTSDFKQRAPSITTIKQRVLGSYSAPLDLCHLCQS